MKLNLLTNNSNTYHINPHVVTGHITFFINSPQERHQNFEVPQALLENLC